MSETQLGLQSKVRQTTLDNYEQALRDAYELYYQLKTQYIGNEGVIVKLAMVKTKIVIIKKKIRDL